VSTPQTNVPSIRSNLDTIPSDDGRSEILTHDINRLLQHLHDLDQVRGEENQELAGNVRAIRDELYDLSDFLRRAQPVHQDQSVGSSVPISEQPAGPRAMPVSTRPISLTPPPPLRVPSPSSMSSSETFLSSHHSDDDVLEEAYAPYSPPLSPAISAPPTERPSVGSSSVSSGSYPSSPSSSSPHPTPPLSVTPSTSSASTVRPPVTPVDIQGLLEGVKNQVLDLWNGQLATHDMLNELRGHLPLPESDIPNRLRAIEDLIRNIRRRSDGSLLTRETESGSDISDLDRLRERLADITAQSDQPPIHMPTPTRVGPSLDEELAAMLRAEPQHPPAIQQPPELIPFRYHPAGRASRPRSTSPTLTRRPHTEPPEAPADFYDPSSGRRPRRVPQGMPPLRPQQPSGDGYPPVIPSRPTTARPRDERLQDLGRQRREVPPPQPINVCNI
jgi:hypothetical protein